MRGCPLRGRLSAALLAGALGVAPAFAQVAQDATPYVSGGVGQGEAQRLLQQRDDYPLAVEVYRREGRREQYTAGADVRILDRRGAELLSAQAQGPFLFARVPPGRYTVEVTLDGRTRQRAVQVGDGGTTRSIFVFDAPSG